MGHFLITSATPTLGGTFLLILNAVSCLLAREDVGAQLHFAKGPFTDGLSQDVMTCVAVLVRGVLGVVAPGSGSRPPGAFWGQEEALLPGEGREGPPRKDRLPSKKPGKRSNAHQEHGFPRTSSRVVSSSCVLS